VESWVFHQNLKENVKAWCNAQNHQGGSKLSLTNAKDQNDSDHFIQRTLIHLTN
jgi:hypothetical protein